eukprot:4523219-Karenia_brevis.AAC.1
MMMMMMMTMTMMMTMMMRVGNAGVRGCPQVSVGCLWVFLCSPWCPMVSNGVPGYPVRECL